MERKERSNTKKASDKDAKDFMLAEYSMLKDFRESALRQIENRLNFYYTSVSGVTAAIALIYQFSGQGVVVMATASSLLFLLFWLGLMTFNRIIQGHISITRYTKGINLIRGYFVKQYKDVDKHIINPTSDNEPRFGNMGFISKGKTPKINKIGLTAMTMLLNSFVITVLFLVNLQLLFKPAIVSAFLMGIFLFLLSLAIHDTYVKKIVREAEAAYTRASKSAGAEKTPSQHH